MVLTMTAGTGVIMWLGELVTDKGIGNGMSILIFTSIAARFPSSLWAIQQRSGWTVFIGIILMGFAVIALVVFVEQSQRRIPVQYAKRMVGRRGLRRHVHLHPAQGQHGRRHPGHLRQLAAVAADAAGPVQPALRRHQPRLRTVEALVRSAAASTRQQRAREE